MIDCLAGSFRPELAGAYNLYDDAKTLRSYRTSARSFISAFAEAEVVLHRNEFFPQPDDEAYRIFRRARVARERRPPLDAHL